jgi:hypothetical protein
MHLGEPQMLEELDKPPGHSTFCVHSHRLVSCLTRRACVTLSLVPAIPWSRIVYFFISEVNRLMPSSGKWRRVLRV